MDIKNFFRTLGLAAAGYFALNAADANAQTKPEEEFTFEEVESTPAAKPAETKAGAAKPAVKVEEATPAATPAQPAETMSLAELKALADKGVATAQAVYDALKFQYEGRKDIRLGCDPIDGMYALDTTTCQIDRMGDWSACVTGNIPYTNDFVAKQQCLDAKAAAKPKKKAAPVAPVQCSVHVEDMGLAALVAEAEKNGAVNSVRFVEGSTYSHIMSNAAAFYGAFSSDAAAKQANFGKGKKLLDQKAYDNLVAAYNAFDNDNQPDNEKQAAAFAKAYQATLEDITAFMNTHYGVMAVPTTQEGKQGYETQLSKKYKKDQIDAMLRSPALFLFTADAKAAKNLYEKLCWLGDKTAAVVVVPDTGKDPVADAGAGKDGAEEGGRAGDAEAKPAEPTCNDGIKNGTETGIDCGGPCDACDNAPVLNPTDGGQGDSSYRNNEAGLVYLVSLGQDGSRKHLYGVFYDRRIKGAFQLGGAILGMSRAEYNDREETGATVPNADSPNKATTHSYATDRYGSQAFDGVGAQLRASFGWKWIELGVDFGVLMEMYDKLTWTVLQMPDGTVLDSEATNTTDKYALGGMATGRFEFHLPRSWKVLGHCGVVAAGGVYIPFRNSPELEGLAGGNLECHWGRSEDTTTKK